VIRFFKGLLKGQGGTPLKVVTDKLSSYSAAKKELMPVWPILIFCMKAMDVNCYISLLGNQKGK